MLNIRTIILFVAFVVVFVLTIGSMTVRTEAVPAPEGNPAGVLENQERSASLNHVDSIRLYRFSLDECYNLPLSEAAECQKESQASIQLYRSRLDDCYDVPLRELASCRIASQASTP